MIEIFATDDPHDHRLVEGASGLLRRFNRAGVLNSADVHVAGRTCALVGEDDEAVALAVALAVRAVRHGSVCVDLVEIRSALEPELAELTWPPAEEWSDRVAASVLVRASVIHHEDGLVYLDRYWREEGQVCADLLTRAAARPPQVDEASLDAAAERVFPGPAYAEQRAAARSAAAAWTTVLTGGPGTGKTTTVAGLLALLAGQAALSGATPRIALTAPTGKAAARLQEAVVEATARLAPEDRERLGQLSASTLHRLLGWRPGSRTRFRHDRSNRLPHDVIVVDETSMVSLTMMARLLEAVRDGARLVLVGDPDQLASVEAGAVLADLVGGLADRAEGGVHELRTTHRFGARIGALASAVRAGDPDQVLERLAAGDPEVEFVDTDDATGVAEIRELLLGHALAVREAAQDGDPAAAIQALDRHRLLCAHRDGPAGVQYWNRQVERWLADETGVPIGSGWGQEWYVGRPVLVTANDYGLDLFNGDTGVVVRGRSEEQRVVIAGVGRHQLLAPSRLGDVETMHAMTVHKSQGGQAQEVTVLLPSVESPLLSRELFYTAITRAQGRVRVIGTEAAVRAAVSRRARRASGLAQRLTRG